MTPGDPQTLVADRTRLAALLAEGRWVEADILFETSNVSVIDYQDLKTLQPGKERGPRIIRLLMNFSFEEADALAQQIRDSDLAQAYKRLRAEYVAEETRWRRREEARCRQQEAERQRTAALRREREERAKRKQQILQRLIELVQNFQIERADSKFAAQNLVSLKQYRTLKARRFAQWVNENSDFDLDEEQAQALAGTARNTLIRARAGSGKTRVLAAQAALLIRAHHVPHERVMVLAFNKPAAAGIGKRIRAGMRVPEFDNARTFHSLAWQVVQPQEKLLADGREFEGSESLSEFLRQTIREIWNPLFQQKLARYFRRELRQFENLGSLLSDKEYRIYIRTARDTTLGGDQVKSRGEKYIADFLFEHAIDYGYERPFRWGSRIYRPDFFIWQGGTKVVLEHWGVSKDPKRSAVFNDDAREDERYRRSMKEKKAYWDAKGTPFVETSMDDLNGGREAFENILRSRLTAAGIQCVRLPDEEIERRVVRRNRSKITQLFAQLISRCKKHQITAADLERMCADLKAPESRETIFLQLGAEVMRAYEMRKKRENRIDFDDLLIRACQRVEEVGGGDDLAVTVNNKRVPVLRTKWYLIDEFQDFSPLFNRLLAALRSKSENTRVTSVGDDWQAINGFAGSTLEYFSQFEEYLPDSEVADVTRNYRSDRLIVTHANELMNGLGPPATPTLELPDSAVEVRDVTKIWVESRNASEFANARNSDLRFAFNRVIDGKEYFDPYGQIKAQYLKACYEIVDQNPEKTVAILARTNSLYFCDLTVFENRLKQCFEPKERRVRFAKKRVQAKTVHKYKGLEADVVILLEVCEGRFPLVHADSRLFEPLGLTIQSVLDEERRLFYVALTRAVEKLFILTEQGRFSPYLDEIGVTPGLNRLPDLAF